MKLSFKLFFLVSIFWYVRSQATDLYIDTYQKDIQTVNIKIALRNEDARSKPLKKAAMLERGKFFASLKMAEPYYVYIVLNDSQATEPFFLDNRATKIEITIDKNLNLTIKNSAVQDEYLTTYNPALEEINREITDFFTGEYRDSYIKYNGQFPDSVNNKFDTMRSQLREKRFSIMKDYITNHPDSYVAMWKLLEEIEIYGYKQQLAENYGRFSERLKISAIGKMVGHKLALALSLEPGNLFPALPLRDMQLKSVQFKPAGKGKYILVDFWYSNCYPCIEQFTALKRLYEVHTRNQFTIISVSVDKLKDVSKWRKAIAKYDLPFTQYIDGDGTVSYSKLSIVKFPTNFLLDANGKIINRDITPEKLKTFLEKEL